MKVQYTQIVGVESDLNSVKIKFRPKGSDYLANPVSVTVHPHDDHLYLNLNFAEFENGGNTSSIPIKSAFG
jgi:hypothetical protein